MKKSKNINPSNRVSFIAANQIEINPSGGETVEGQPGATVFVLVPSHSRSRNLVLGLVRSSPESFMQIDESIADIAKGQL